MVQQIWDEIPSFYPNVDIDAFVVMPNHIHGIIVLPSTAADLYPESLVVDGIPVGASPCGRPGFPNNPAMDEILFPEPSITIRSDHDMIDGQHGRPQGGAPTGFQEGTLAAGQPRLSLFDVVERYKSLTTKRYGDGVRNDGWSPYRGKLWQRGYYERVVRNERELAKFRAYIETNPARWFEDPYRGN